MATTHELQISLNSSVRHSTNLHERIQHEPFETCESTVFALCALAFPSVHAQSTGNEADIAQIQKLQGLYVQSIDNADTTLVDQVWLHAPEVIFVEPRGTERGLQQVEDFVKNTFGAIFSKRDLQLESPAIHVYGDTAWSEMTWTFHATIRGNNQAITTKGRETQILRKENGQWHMLAIHYSEPPVTGQLKGF